MFAALKAESQESPTNGIRMGYLAFPPRFSMSSEKTWSTTEQAQQPEPSMEIKIELENESVDQAYQEQLRLMEELSRKREARERGEALIGEKHWVRQGGILRDANGRRDPKRTEEIRRLVEKEDRENRIRERWATYENAWAQLSSSNEPVTFPSMPWPLATPPKNPAQLRDSIAIASFLFESLDLPDISVTRKDRLRASLLRWHPDKLSGIIARTAQAERDPVKEGIDAVVISLRSLQEEERAK